MTNQPPNPWINTLRSENARLAVRIGDLENIITTMSDEITELRSRLAAYECPDCGRIAARIEHSGHREGCPRQEALK